MNRAPKTIKIPLAKYKGKYQCPHCMKEYQSKFSANRHVLEKHYDIIEKVQGRIRESTFNRFGLVRRI